MKQLEASYKLVPLPVFLLANLAAEEAGMNCSTRGRRLHMLLRYREVKYIKDIDIAALDDRYKCQYDAAA